MTIYLDFDNIIVESNKRIIDMLNKKYGTSKTEDDLFDYNYNSIYPISEKEKLQMFESEEFYNGLEFKTGVLDVLNKYSQSYNIIILSVGTEENLKRKQAWLKNNLPYDFEFIGINGKSKKKSHINMDNAIQIDDNFDCLKTNATLKILYKSFHNFPWQEPTSNEELMVVNTWEEIDSILDFYKKYNCKTLEKIK